MNNNLLSRFPIFKTEKRLSLYRVGSWHVARKEFFFWGGNGQNVASSENLVGWGNNVAVISKNRKARFLRKEELIFPKF